MEIRNLSNTRSAPHVPVAVRWCVQCDFSVMLLKIKRVLSLSRVWYSSEEQEDVLKVCWLLCLADIHLTHCSTQGLEKQCYREGKISAREWMPARGREGKNTNILTQITAYSFLKRNGTHGGKTCGLAAHTHTHTHTHTDTNTETHTHSLSVCIGGLCTCRKS